jgi:hypothetical protein
MTTQAHSARDLDVRELEHEAAQLAPGTSYVSIMLPRSAVRLLADLARAEWDRRQAETAGGRL